VNLPGFLLRRPFTALYSPAVLAGAVTIDFTGELPMRTLAPLILLGMCSSAVWAENWPQWRGARLDGVSQEQDLPVQWSNTENVAWRFPLPGPGGATPVVWDDRIFVTAPQGDDLLLICVGTDGREQWRQTVTRGNRSVRGDEGNSCSPSPSTDGRHVWTFFTDGTLACYTVDGKEVWKTNLQERYGKFDIQFGMTSTPVLDGDRIYLQLMHGPLRGETKTAIVCALDHLTGKEIWKQNRPSDGTFECKHSYASPIVYRDGKHAFLISHGADYAVGHSLDDGRELWRCGGLNPKSNYEPTLRFVASPSSGEGRIVVPSAKNGPVICLKPDAMGDVTNNSAAYFWTKDQGTPDVPSPLIHDGLVYLCRENGNLVCLDAETGEQYYEERTVRERHRASPVVADGKVYITARNGVITVVKAGKTFEMLSQNAMGEEMSASPAISNGRIYLRTFEALYAIGK
jgi:outer membrane protein assembly factor BamB